MAGIYIHIPFCKQACHYCDFHFSTNTSHREELIRCMAQEVILQRNYLQGETIQTIYFGGGTPSILSAAELQLLLEPIHKVFSIGDHTEITLEANPDDLNLIKLTELRDAGFNRLSIGIQSFQDSVLQFLNRAHDSSSAVRSIEDARKAGFQNLSVDLIYGIPNQSDAEWNKNIAKVISLNPEHISAYSLTIEDNTTFGKWATRGKLKAVDDEHVATQLEILIDALSVAGYEQYEVSNFSKPHFESRHNSSYWKQLKYLGIGPSAHSYNKITRQHNVRNNHHYIRSIQQGNIPFEVEILTRNDHVNEYLLTTLRTRWGSDLDKLKYELQYDINSVHQQLISELLDRKLAVIENNFLKLTKSGRMIADKICTDLFLVS